MPENARLFSAPGHALGARGSVVVQVRLGPLTEAVLDEIATSLRLWNAARPASQPRALLAVLGEQARIPEGAVAEAQRKLLTRFTGQPNMFVAIVLEGSGIGVAARRAFYRLLSPGRQRTIVATADDGVAWLTTQLAQPDERAPLTAFAAELRRGAAAVAR